MTLFLKLMTFYFINIFKNYLNVILFDYFVIILLAAHYIFNILKKFIKIFITCDWGLLLVLVPDFRSYFKMIFYLIINLFSIIGKSSNKRLFFNSFDVKVRDHYLKNYFFSKFFFTNYNLRFIISIWCLFFSEMKQ